jgi:preprotein translocase subunit SecE
MKDERRHTRSRTRMVLIIIAVMAVLVSGFEAKRLLLG